LTRQLTEKEYEMIGRPKEWGVLPVRPMGATVRFIKDKRILIRNTSEYRNPNFMDQQTLDKRISIHKIGLKKRFPSLPDEIISSSWSGVVSRSSNGSQIFEKIDKNIFVAGSYFGSGIGAGVLFGEQIALMATDQQSEEIKIIDERKKPNKLPIRFILNLGIRTRLIYERFRARSEI
jgi:glycine/D-amino acid oxidase-like deaminating enzyme